MNFGVVEAHFIRTPIQRDYRWISYEYRRFEVEAEVYSAHMCRMRMDVTTFLNDISLLAGILNENKIRFNVPH